MEKYELKMRQWEQRERFWRAAGTLKAGRPAGERQAKWLSAILPSLTFSPGQSERQYYRFKAHMPLLLQEAETYENLIKEWEQVSITLQP